MADLIYKQMLQLVVGKGSNNIVTCADFQIDPPETQSFSDYNESQKCRVIIPPSTLDFIIPMGTVALGKLLIIKMEADMLIKITNVNGTSQDINVKNSRLSIMHVDFTGLSVSNINTTDLKGIIFIAGD